MGFFSGKALGQGFAYRVFFVFCLNNTNLLVLFYLFFGAGSKFFFLRKQIKTTKIELSLQRIFIDVPFAGFAPDLSLEHLDLLFQLSDGGIFLVDQLLVRNSFFFEVFKAGKLAFKFGCLTVKLVAILQNLL